RRSALALDQAAPQHPGAERDEGDDQHRLGEELVEAGELETEVAQQPAVGERIERQRPAEQGEDAVEDVEGAEPEGVRELAERLLEVADRVRDTGLRVDVEAVVRDRVARLGLAQGAAVVPRPPRGHRSADLVGERQGVRRGRAEVEGPGEPSLSGWPANLPGWIALRTRGRPGPRAPVPSPVDGRAGCGCSSKKQRG